MFKVGLTGGIGSGKSTVSNFFRSKGILIIDLDQLAHKVVEPNTDAFKKIVSHFGEDILNKNGALNRAKLGSVIFKNIEEKKWLEVLVHPLIREKQRELINSNNSEYTVIEIPLLTENRLENTVDRVLLVDCEEPLQIDRAIKRGMQSAEQIHKIINLQASRTERQSLADDIIVNEGLIEDLEKQLEELHLKYLALAKST